MKPIVVFQHVIETNVHDKKGCSRITVKVTLYFIVAMKKN